MAKAEKKSPAKKAAKKKAAKKTSKSAKKAAEPTGLTPAEMQGDPPAEVQALCDSIGTDGGQVLTAYRDPLGGRWLVLAALPTELVEPTPYQRGLSDTHFKKLAGAIKKVGRYLDPVIAVRTEDGRYQTPNGHHRASALKLLGCRSITALVVTEPEVARLILALNVEKAHNLKEKCEEVIKLARELTKLGEWKEKDLALEFEEPEHVTLGLCYEQRPRFAGSSYSSMLSRADSFRDEALEDTLEQRAAEAEQLLAIDDRVAEVVKEVKALGVDNPYLKNAVVARVNPFRTLKRGAELSVDDMLEKALANATALEATEFTKGGGGESGEGEG